MRLGQLARRLSLRPAQIVEFLADNNIQIDSNSNTRLDDGHVTMIVQHYAPESLALIENEPDEIVVEEKTTEAIPVEITEDPTMAETQEIVTDEVNALEEVIRVQKIELSGLKVLGKIDLPEPKKKEPVVEQKPEESGEVPSTEVPPTEKPVKQRNNNRKPQQNRERSQQRPWKNPMELQRDREAREAEDKKRREIERERERRKKHYEEKVKSVAQPKRTKAVKSQNEEKKKPVDTRPVPKTWLGKFLRWWTT